LRIHLWQSVAAIVFGDGSESRLYPLTKRRSEGAIPIGANYRIVDAVISNCINSNINKIYALTQYNSTYLNSHLSRAYSGLGLGKDGFVEVIAAYQSLEEQGWFQVY
jgi:glucose-1-phosphate adenylyltransferase